MAQWDQLGMDAKITQILDVQSHEPGHHFGRLFMTPYQIAIAFKNRFPQDFQTIGKPVGGIRVGQQDTLAQYIALVLSKRIKDGKIGNIEGRFLHRANLKTLQYDDSGQKIESSSQQAYDLSLYRLID